MGRFMFSLFLLLAFLTFSHAQEIRGPEAPPPEKPLVTSPPAPPPESVSPDVVEKAQEILKEKGFTPEALEKLKGMPEYKGLTIEDILKGKEILEKKEKEEVTKPSVLQERAVVIEEEKPGTIFEKYRQIGDYRAIDTKLSRFGDEFFREAAVKVITERKDIPVPAKYVVGPGDEVRILLWGRVNATYNLTVNRDGKITIPQIGPVTVAGMTFEEMSRKLIELSEQIIGANIDVTLGSLKTIPIFVLGDVRRPGAYLIGSFATITDALLLSGGPSKIGSMRKIELRRNDKVHTTFDLYDLLLKGDKSKDVMLQAGDIVFVPPCGPLVGIAGNVKRPAVYELKDKFDLETLINMAGGIIPSGYIQHVQVERIVKHEKQIILDLDVRDASKMKLFTLEDGDFVKIFNIVDIKKNAVYLYGNVKRPGEYEWKEGLRIRDLIKSYEDLKLDTYVKYGLVKRIEPPEMKEVLLPFSVEEMLSGNEDHNLRLEPQDAVYIFSKWLFMDKPTVRVEGEVRRPGTFVISENTRVKDAILLAGDLKKDAYLKKAEIIRRTKNRDLVTLYFDVEKAMMDDPEENIVLQDEDRIVIHSIWEEKWKESVNIEGEVKKPGEYLLTENMRVSDLIFKAGGITRDTLLDEAEIYRTDWRTKEIKVIKFNLQKALEKDAESDIQLKDLDRVVVHSIWEKVYKKNVHISGAVLKPGTYPYAENMKLKDLIFSAGNVLESAYLEEVEIVRQKIVNERQVTFETLRVNLKKALLDDPKENITLLPHDRVYVKQISDWGKFWTVKIDGEVLFPGVYPIKKGETLSSLIERAGGYKDTAYLRGAVFTRSSVKEMQKKVLDEMISRLEREILLEAGTRISGALSPEEVEARKAEIAQRQKFIESLRKIEPSGRMTVKLSHLRLLKGSEFDIPLEDGDSLYIPPKNPVVTVVGAVMSQGNFIYRDGFTHRDYIQLAGGLSRFADEKNIFVLKVDGSARKIGSSLLSWNFLKSRWEISRFTDEEKIEPGDTIVVPEKVERIAWLRNIKDITQILMNTAVVAGTVKYLFE
ncbi:MAG: SLBB domain-containing protein [Candidatus Bathyarchaeia archaeon]